VAVKCETMTDVRREIDRLDRELVTLLAERQCYIEQAGQIKASRDKVRDVPRIEDVIAKVLAAAKEAGLSPAMAEPVWRLLIEKSIEHEYVEFDAHEQSDTAAR